MASLIHRGSTYYLSYYVGGKERRRSLETDSLAIAKEKLRQYESAVLRGDECPLPTRTPLAEILDGYVAHVRAHKTPKSAQTDVYYLRDAFGPICVGLQVTSRKLSAKAKKRPPLDGVDLRFRPARIEAEYLEHVTTAQIAAFIQSQVETRGIAAKTANHYREVLSALFNWAARQRGAKLSNGRNPVTAVKRFRETAPEIRFLTLEQVAEQLEALKGNPQLQTMVAVLIYAGLRREELLWLTVDDLDLATGAHGMIRVRAKTVAEDKWQPKTKINRAVPISAALRAYLDRYTVRPSDGGWFFPSPDGKHWDPDNFSRTLRAANDAAKLDWACLDYRHTFGSQLAMKGESLYKISKLMGNSPEICRRHYAALVPESMADSVEFETAPIAPARPTPPVSPGFPRLRLVGE